MKAFKRYSAARKQANGEPIVRVGDLYIVGITKSQGYLTEISLIAGDGRITGNVTARHLDRLGNANWAESKDTRNKEYIWDENKIGIEKRPSSKLESCLQSLRKLVNLSGHPYFPVLPDLPAWSEAIQEARNIL